MAEDEDEARDEGEVDEADGEASSKLEDGGSVEVEGSSSTYTLTRHGSVYMCSCPAWKNQSAPVDLRTCKHLRAYLGEEFETKRLGSLPSRAASTRSGGGSAAKKETAPPVLLAHKWETGHDPTGWWMSEKLDGIRAYWDGETFVSRLGNRFFAPDWFVEDLPADTLDGELWVGRKMFQRTTSIVRSGAANHEWRSVQYVVFDAPNAKGTFEDRQHHAQKVLTKAGAPHARWHDHVLCEGFDHLRDELARVESLGGEGLMLRQPRSKYVAGRSTTLLKVKTFHDAEATVVGHAPGTGKHKGRLGALIVELPGGIRFNVGTGFSDAEREDPPAIGTVITFRYQELSDDGVPRFPSWIGERLDVKVPAPIGKSSRKLATVPLGKGTGGASSGAKTTAPESRVAAKARPAPPDDDDDDGDDDAPSPAARTPKPPPPAKSASAIKPPPKLETPASHEIARGKKFMFTGKLASMMRSQAQAKVKAIGGINAGSVSTDLDYLVVGDDGSPLFGAGAKGDKILKAEKLINQGHAIKIISERAFMDLADATVRAKPAARPAPNVMPPKPPRPPPPEDDEDDEEDDEELATSSAASPEAEPDDSPMAKYGAVAWQCKLVNEDEGKFWEIEVRGKVHVTRFGKIGSTGQMRLTDIGSATHARTDAEKRAVAKRREGYR